MIKKRSNLLLEPFHPDLSNTVFIGQKPAEKSEEDLVQGHARLGGFWRQPSYLESYRLSASLLIEQGRLRGGYDEIGLPAFYLQRHATELLIKRLLKWCIGIIELRAEATGDPSLKVSGKMRYALGSHDLKVIHKALLKAASKAGELPPSELLAVLVERIAEIESSDHWSRYDNGQGPSHHEQEKVIPIVGLQRLLENAFDRCLVRDFEEGSYEMELYSTHEGLACALDSLDEG